MAAEARDSTEDWILPAAARPRSFAELESRVDVAIALAQSSEAAVAEVGAAAIEAAEQARQAAELAARAASAAEEAAARGPAGEPVSTPASSSVPEESPERVEPQEQWLLSFTHRAERLSERLVRLQSV